MSDDQGFVNDLGSRSQPPAYQTLASRCSLAPCSYLTPGNWERQGCESRGTGVPSSLPSYNLWSRLLFHTSVNTDQAKPLLSAAGRARAHQPRGISHNGELRRPWRAHGMRLGKVPSASPTSFRETSDGGTHLEELQTPCRGCLAQWGLPSKFTGLPMLLPVPVILRLPLLRSPWAPMLSSCQSPLCRPILVPALFMGRGLQPWLQAQLHL